MATIDPAIVPKAASEPDIGTEDLANESDKGRTARTLARSGLIAVAGSAVNGTAAFVVAVIIARGSVDTSASGAVFVATAVFNIAYLVATLGAEVGLVRYVARDHSSTRRLLRGAAIPAATAGLLAAIAIVAARHSLGDWFSDGTDGGQVASALRGVGPLVPLATMAAVALAATRGLATMVPTAVIDRIVRPLSQVALVSLAALVGASAGGMALAWALAFVPSFVGAWWWIGRHAPKQNPGFKATNVADPVVLPNMADRLASRAPATEAEAVSRDATYWEFTTPQALTSILAVVLRWSDIVLVAALAGTGTAAIYTAASRLLLAGTFVNGAIMQTVSPLVSSALGRGDVAEAKRLLSTGTAWLVAIVWPGYIALGALGAGFLTVFGQEYTAGATALAILSVAMLVATGVGPIEAVLLMDGGSEQSLINNLAAVTVMIGVDLILIPSHGLTGAAIGWACGLLITNLGPLWQVYRRLGITPFGRAHSIATVTATLSMGVVAGTVRLFGEPTLAVAAAAAIAGWTIHLFVLSRNSDELMLNELRSALRRRG